MEGLMTYGPRCLSLLKSMARQKDCGRDYGRLRDMSHLCRCRAYRDFGLCTMDDQVHLTK